MLQDVRVGKLVVTNKVSEAWSQNVGEVNLLMRRRQLAAEILRNESIDMLDKVGVDGAALLLRHVNMYKDGLANRKS